MGIDIGLLPNICQQIHDIVNKQENSKQKQYFFERKLFINSNILVSNRISRLYPKFSETPSSTSTTIGLNDLIQAANICLEKRLTSHSISDENFSKLKLALEQIHTTIERTEQMHKTLDHLEHLPKHIQHYDQEQKTSFDHIATKFYSSIDCGQQAREAFREQMTKQTPNSFVTCCNTIATISADDSNSDFMNDDTTIIRCQIPITFLPDNEEGMLKGLECLLLNEPMKNDDESFLTLEQECRMDSEIFVDRNTILETNIEAVMLNEKMEGEHPEKENITPGQQQISEIQIEKMENDIQFISPIISVPIGQ
jgi:hypothetical protein